MWRWVSRNMRRIIKRLPNRVVRKMRTMRIKRNRPILEEGTSPSKMKSVDV